MTAQQPPDRNGTSREIAREQGEQFVTLFYRVMRSAALYELTNPTFLAVVRELLSIIRNLPDDIDRLEVKVIQDACFCGGGIIRCRAESFAGYKGFVGWMHAHLLSEMTIETCVSDADFAAFINLCAHLPEGREDNAHEVNAQLLLQDMHTVRVKPLRESLLEADASPEKLSRRSKQVYFSGIGLVHEMMDDVKFNHSLDLRKAKRLIFNAVELIMKDQTALLGLTTIKRYDSYTFNHSMNVAIYAIALGHQLQLSQKALSYLGIAGLFHDLGKTDISREILDKPGTLSQEEWAAIHEHPRQGARIMLQMKGWSQASAHVIAACYEHHLRYNLTGYPKVTRAQLPTLFSRIITVADCYDALSTPRVYRRDCYPSEKILALMLQESGTQFDPTLVKLMINLMGIYPLGALVELDSGEMGIVARIAADPEFIARPQVCLLDREAGDYVRGEVVDLRDADPVTGAYRRNILRTLNPHEHGIDLEALAV